MADGERPTGWLNRNVVGMGITSFLADLGYETASAVLPAFLIALEAPAAALGVIEGSADAIASFAKLASGWWGDRFGHRKAIVTLGYLLSGGLTAVFAVATAWPVVLVGRVFAWLGRGLRGPLRNAILAESVPAADRGKAFGFHSAGDTLGAIAGPLLAAALLAWLPFQPSDATGSYRLIFWLAVIPGVGSALAFLALVRDPMLGTGSTRKFWASVQALPRGFRRYLVGVACFGAGDFSHALLILAAMTWLKTEYGAERAAQFGILLYAVRNILHATAAFPVGDLSDRIGRRPLLVLGYVLGAAVMIGFSVAPTGLAALAVLFALAGVYVSVEEALEGALAADLVSDLSVRGTAFGVLGAVNGLGDLVSSIVVGLLLDLNPALGFGYAAVTMLAGAVLIHRVR